MPTNKKLAKAPQSEDDQEIPRPRLKPGTGSWGSRKSATNATKSQALANSLVPDVILPDLPDEERRQKELLFVMPVNIAVAGIWQRSEDYSRRKDEEMIHYLQFWPLEKWLIDAVEAQQAYDALQTRLNLRQVGKSIYGDGVPSWRPFGEHYELPLRPQQINMDLPSKADMPSFAPINVHVPASRARPAKVQAAKVQKPGTARLEGTPGGDSADTVPPAQPKPTKAAKQARPRRSMTLTDPLLEPLPTVEGQPDDEEYTAKPPPKKRKLNGIKKENSETAKKPVPKKCVMPGEKLYTDRKRIIIGQATSPPPYESDGVRMKPDGDFPWQCVHAAETPIEWDDSIYTPERLKHLDQVHVRNMRIVSKYMEDSKRHANERKNAAIEAFKAGDVDNLGPPPDLPVAERAGSNHRVRKARQVDHVESYAGNLIFADAKATELFKSLKYKSVDRAVEAAMLDPHNPELMALEVAHDPGDSSLIKDLELPRITVMDIARTRLQYRHTKILTDRAAERIIDFCPDMLTAFTVLQIAAETKYSNTSIQTRVGSNGTMMSDSTITKRVSAALNRDFDKVAIETAKAKTPEYRKINRQTYDKYKAWRAAQRQHVVPIIRKFDLDAAAAEYRLSKGDSLGSPSDDRSVSEESALTDLTEQGPAEIDALELARAALDSVMGGTIEQQSVDTDKVLGPPQPAAAAKPAPKRRRAPRTSAVREPSPDGILSSIMQASAKANPGTSTQTSDSDVKVKAEAESTHATTAAHRTASTEARPTSATQTYTIATVPPHPTLQTFGPTNAADYEELIGKALDNLTNHRIGTSLPRDQLSYQLGIAHKLSDYELAHSNSSTSDPKSEACEKKEKELSRHLESYWNAGSRKLAGRGATKNGIGWNKIVIGLEDALTPGRKGKKEVVRNDQKVVGEKEGEAEKGISGQAVGRDTKRRREETEETKIGEADRAAKMNGVKAEESTALVEGSRDVEMFEA